jgi:hypothetical protein
VEDHLDGLDVNSSDQQTRGERVMSKEPGNVFKIKVGPDEILTITTAPGYDLADVLDLLRRHSSRPPCEPTWRLATPEEAEILDHSTAEDGSVCRCEALCDVAAHNSAVAMKLPRDEGGYDWLVLISKYGRV